jgi:hypothetical protein
MFVTIWLPFPLFLLYPCVTQANTARAVSGNVIALALNWQWLLRIDGSKGDESPPPSDRARN